MPSCIVYSLYSLSLPSSGPIKSYFHKRWQETHCKFLTRTGYHSNNKQKDLLVSSTMRCHLWQCLAEWNINLRCHYCHGWGMISNLYANNTYFSTFHDPLFFYGWFSFALALGNVRSSALADASAQRKYENRDHSKAGCPVLICKMAAQFTLMCQSPLWLASPALRGPRPLIFKAAANARL